MNVDKAIRWEAAKEDKGEKIGLHKKFSLRKRERGQFKSAEKIQK